MKKIYLFLISALLLASFTVARADEGMWMLPMLEKMNIRTMHKMGLKLSAKDIYDINHSSLKDAIVHFGGGCTAEVISDRGLLITNHHCGYESIQQLSSVEHDYLNDGYWAMSQNQELPAKGLSVTFICEFRDVSSLLLNAKDKKEVRKNLVEEAEAKDSTIKAKIYSFYNNNQYYLITTRTFKDIRFVGAPPASIGKFGGETDNWMWPRQTGDFSMFRIYADKNNNPADYSKDNVPYKAERALTISLKGMEPKDFTMIIGFPGRTSRYMTSEEVKEQEQTENAPEVYLRGIRQGIMEKYMKASEKVRIQYASKYAMSSNGWKKWKGMNETFDRLNVIARRSENEKNFTEWVNEDTERKAEYGKALSKINKVVKQRMDLLYVLVNMSETINSIELLKAVSNSKHGKEMENFYKDYYEPLDREEAAAMLKAYKKQVDAKYLPKFYTSIIGKRFGGNIDAFVNYVYDNSAYTSLEKYEKAKKDSILKKDIADTLFTQFSFKIMPVYGKYRKSEGKFLEGRKEYMKGIMEMKGRDAAIYPDANSTMRLTYGKVGGYSPKDGVEYKYYTTLTGVMQKEDPDNWEFVVPSKLKSLWQAKDFGRYADRDGTMHTCFLTNNDITGGNSGSPVLNGKGELLGLAFDGNWESMSSDVIFEPNLQRCICVDIRYVMFIIDKFGGAGYLLDEMKFDKRNK
ncbi:MAG: S46 family peptidase [Bacteroidales bacterium]|jgi:hypothetical protein|nr:S46 family peptidase [Bacteroidales bacterium]